jgi:hypothetical protein
MWGPGRSREDVEHETKGFPGSARVEAVMAAGRDEWFAENRDSVGDRRAGLVELSGIEGLDERVRETIFSRVVFVGRRDHGGGVQDRDGPGCVPSIGVMDGSQPSFDPSDDETGREGMGAAGEVAYGFPGG